MFSATMLTLQNLHFNLGVLARQCLCMLCACSLFYFCHSCSWTGLGVFLFLSLCCLSLPAGSWLHSPINLIQQSPLRYLTTQLTASPCWIVVLHMNPLLPVCLFRLPPCPSACHARFPGSAASSHLPSQNSDWILCSPYYLLYSKIALYSFYRLPHPEN